MKAVTLSSRYWMDMVASHGNVFFIRMGVHISG